LFLSFLHEVGVLNVLRKNNAFELNDLSSKVRASIRLAYDIYITHSFIFLLI